MPRRTFKRRFAAGVLMMGAGLFMSGFFFAVAIVTPLWWCESWRVSMPALGLTICAAVLFVAGLVRIVRLPDTPSCGNLNDPV